MAKVIFKDRTVLVTGGGSGIGEAIACQFARKGTNVILAGRREAELQRVALKCGAFGVRTWCRPLDLEKKESIDALAEWIGSEGLKIDFFLLNAGVSQRAKALDTSIETDRKLMEINYFGGVYLIKSLKDMILAGESIHIAPVSSISGLFGFPLRSAYCASKRAIHGFYESLDLEYPNIHVTMLVPGRIRTEISKSAITATGDKFGQMDPGQANGMDVDACAEVAIRAIAKEKHQKLIGGTELLMAHIYRYCRCLYWKLAGKISAH